jgi:hypothetical protein
VLPERLSQPHRVSTITWVKPLGAGVLALAAIAATFWHLGNEFSSLAEVPAAVDCVMPSDGPQVSLLRCQQQDSAQVRQQSVHAKESALLFENWSYTQASQPTPQLPTLQETLQIITSLYGFLFSLLPPPPPPNPLFNNPIGLPFGLNNQPVTPFGMVAVGSKVTVLPLVTATAQVEPSQKQTIPTPGTTNIPVPSAGPGTTTIQVTTTIVATSPVFGANPRPAVTIVTVQVNIVIVTPAPRRPASAIQ